MARSWLDSLRAHVVRKPIHVFRFSGGEWSALCESRKGIENFTVARGHKSVEEIHPPSICLIRSEGDEFGGDPCVCMAVVESRKPVTTLESRLKFKSAFHLAQSNERELIDLLRGTAFESSARNRFENNDSVFRLSPKLCDELVSRLAKSKQNQPGMRRLAETIVSRHEFSVARNFQADAIRTALDVFGIPTDATAISVELDEGKETALAVIPVIEDAVIEHDARRLPGYELIDSDITGKAWFSGPDGQLQVITANRKELEHCLGVDLIYINQTQGSVVMLQYKMLERYEKKNAPDWVYRPDDQMQKQFQAMKTFKRNCTPAIHEYRINPQVFYWKFVKRDASPGHGAIILPLDHLEVLMMDPACRGPRGGFRISYESLKGRYLRNGSFIELVKSGYIGSYARETEALKQIVDAILANDKGVVLAIKSAIPEKSPSVEGD